MYYVVRSGKRSRVAPGNGAGYYAGKRGDESNTSTKGVTFCDMRKSECERVANAENETGKVAGRPGKEVTE